MRGCIVYTLNLSIKVRKPTFFLDSLCEVIGGRRKSSKMKSV